MFALSDGTLYGVEYSLKEMKAMACIESTRVTNGRHESSKNITTKDNFPIVRIDSVSRENIQV